MTGVQTEFPGDNDVFRPSATFRATRLNLLSPPPTTTSLSREMRQQNTAPIEKRTQANNRRGADRGISIFLSQSTVATRYLKVKRWEVSPRITSIDARVAVS